MPAVSQADAGVGARLWPARLAWAGFGLLLALLGLVWAKFALNGYLTAVFPVELDYGEGIVWQQALLIPGPRMYGDVQQYPYIVFHYPPLYHLVVRLVASAGLPWLEAGRFVSFGSMAAAAVLAAGFVADGTRVLPRPAALAGALVAGLLFPTLSPMVQWSLLMRVDMLALALELLGMVLALQALRRPRLAYAAATVFVLAAFTRQTAILGAVAAFATVLPRIPRHAVRAFAFAVLLGGAAFAALTLATGGGFARNVVLYNVNRFSLGMVFEQLRRLGIVRTCWPVLVIAVAMAAATGARMAGTLRGHGRREAVPPAETMALLYFLLGTASLVTLGKSGANSNYALPWLTGAILLTGFATASAARLLTIRPPQAVPALALLPLLVLQTTAAPVIGDRQLVNPVYRRAYAAFIERIRQADKPVLSTDMTALLQAGKKVPWEPAIITELISKGRFDERKLLDRIEAHEFAFVVLTGDPKDAARDERYSPAVVAAILEAYPRVERMVGHYLLLPEEQGQPGK